MADKNNLNNALSDWFPNETKPKVESKITPLYTNEKINKVDKIETKPIESKKEENKISRNIETKNNSNQEIQRNIKRVKFGTMIRADLLKKLKVKSVQDDKSIYELIEDAIEKLVK
jgi:hypothetical protein